MDITVVDFDTEWVKKYEAEELQIKSILQDELIRSFHIGSTSIKGLKAKPIIDILLVVEDINKLEFYSEKFQAIGYEVMGEFGIVGRRYFRKGGDNRTHQIHAFQFDNLQEIERHLIFRDYLRQHPEACKEYGDLKSKLAKMYPTDIESYGDGKEALIRKIEKQALKWHFIKY